MKSASKTMKASVAAVEKQPKKAATAKKAEPAKKVEASKKAAPAPAKKAAPVKKITPAPAKKAPVSEAKRAEIKQEVTDSKGLAEAIQIKQLKTALAELNRIDPSQEEFIQQIVVKTENFTTLTKEKCTQLILKVGELIDECKQGVVEE